MKKFGGGGTRVEGISDYCLVPWAKTCNLLAFYSNFLIIFSFINNGHKMHTIFYHNAKNISVDFLKKEYIFQSILLSHKICHAVFKMGLKLLWITNSNYPKKKYMVICILHHRDTQ